jgi:hypothetical protein
MNYSRTIQAPAVSCEHNNEPKGFAQKEEFFECLMSLSVLRGLLLCVETQSLF